MQGRGVNPLDAKLLQANSRAHNVDDGIGTAHLVKMDLSQWHAVNLRFGLTQPGEDSGGRFFDPIR